MPASNLSYVIGSRVRATARMPIGLDAIIETGEYGTVTEMGEGFIVCVRWDCPHDGLAWVNNETMMECGGVHLTLLPVRDQPAEARTRLQRARWAGWSPRLAAGAIVGAFFIGWLAPRLDGAASVLHCADDYPYIVETVALMLKLVE